MPMSENDHIESDEGDPLRSFRSWTIGFTFAGLIYALASLIPAILLHPLDASFAVRNFAGAAFSLLLAFLAYSYRNRTIAGTVLRSTANCLIALSLVFSILMALLWVGEMLSS